MNTWETGKPDAAASCVKHVQKQLEVSERRACGVMDQPRSSQRYQSQTT